MFTNFKKWIQHKIDILDKFIFMEGRCQSEAGGFAAGFSAGFNAVMSAKERADKLKKEEEDRKREEAKLKREKDALDAKNSFNVKTNMTSAHANYLKTKQEILADEKLSPEDRTSMINDAKKNMLNTFNVNAQYAQNVGIMDGQMQGAVNGIYQLGEFEEEAVITDKNGNSFHAPKSIVDEYNNRVEAGTAKIEADGTIKFTDMSGDTKQDQPIYKASKFYMGKDKEDKTYTPSTEEKNINLWEKENAELKQTDPKLYTEKRKEFVNGIMNTILVGKTGERNEKSMRQFESNLNRLLDNHSEDFSNPMGIDSKSLTKLKLIEASNTDNKAVNTEEVKADKKRMRNNKMVIDSIDNLLSSDDIEQVETDVAEKSIDFTKKVLGVESADTLRNVDFNTKAGKILFTFINSLSGSAYTAGEISSYKGILMGGDLSDEKYVIGAMNSFRESIVSENEKIGQRLFSVAPESAIVYRQYEKESPYKIDFEEEKKKKKSSINTDSIFR